MGLVKNNRLVEDPFVGVADGGEIPASGPMIVGLAEWRAHREALLGRGEPVGVRLKSDEPPHLIAEDLDHLAVIALEFPAFRDGRAYSYARLLRERYKYAGEVRAVGDVLLEQLHFMVRTGFDAFEIRAEDPLAAFRTAMADFSVWYQPSSDGRPTALQLRHGAHRQ
jgi:uncharacterized protein (DUF934 family)